MNDGLCGMHLLLYRVVVIDKIKETECCDGSDEPAGVCLNKCQEIEEVYRKKRDGELKIQRTVRVVSTSMFNTYPTIRVPKFDLHTSLLHIRRKNASK